MGTEMTAVQPAEENILQRKYKDSAFLMVFGEPEKMVELYNAIFDTSYPPDTKIDINTIEDVFFGTRKNDVAFTLDDTYIVLSEHQSTINRNMPLRHLMYITEIWKTMFDRKEIYKEKLIRLPRPTFVVLYNGTDPLPPVSRLELSDCFLGEGKSLLNLSVVVYNINEGAGCKLLEKSETLAQYSRLVALIRSYQGKGPVTHRVMREITEVCLREGILVELMEKYGNTILDYLHFELTEEEARDFYREDGFEQGLSQGLSQGKEIGAAQATERLNKLNDLLLEADRIADLKRAAKEPAFQQLLLEEFGL